MERPRNCDADGLLEDIIANPHDDTPRLIYADWLEEHEPDNNQAALIRLQNAIAALAPDHPERAALVAREHVLIERERQRWITVFALHGVEVNHLWIERGFPFFVGVGLGEFLRHAPAVFSLAPVTSLSLWGIRRNPHLIEDLFDCPLLKKLNELDLSFFHRIGPEGAAMLARSPHVTGLRSLHLRANRLQHHGARALALSPYLTNLEALHLDENDIGVEGALAIAASETLQSVRTLTLSSNRIGEEGVRALADSSRLSLLETLDLRGNGWMEFESDSMSRNTVRKLLLDLDA